MKDLETRYQETLDWIYSWIDFSMNRHVDEAHRFFKLDRMNRLMALNYAIRFVMHLAKF